MSVNNQTTSGVNALSGGLAEEKSEVANEVPSTSGDEVSKDPTYPAHFVNKLKQEKLNKAKQVSELEAKLEAMKAAQAEAAETELAQKEQFKTLWEQEKQRRSDAESKFQGLQSKLVEDQKKKAVTSHLRKLGLNTEFEDTALRLLDINQVLVDQETGSVVGAEEAAKDFREKFKGLDGFFKTATPGVSHQAASVNNVNLSKSTRDMSDEELIAKLKSLG